MARGMGESRLGLGYPLRRSTTPSSAQWRPLHYRAGLLEVLKRFPRTLWALGGLRASISGLKFQCTVSSSPQLACLEGSRAKVGLLDPCPFTKKLLTFGSGMPSGVEQSGCQTKGKCKGPVIGEKVYHANN